ncbi:hypothetical protein ABT104_06085 [Streptomyces mobaraensis]|uniref:hypothetical protein n=1 Tax=Streptomyces mobaraensis TaxID=35621 RepID=UPI00331F5E45
MHPQPYRVWYHVLTSLNTPEHPLWTGLAGQPVGGLTVARHLQATIYLLCAQGWAGDGLHGARRLSLTAAIWRVTDRDLSADSAWAATVLLDHLVRTRTCSRDVGASTWAEHTNRTWEEVGTLLATGVEYARLYGPAVLRNRLTAA